MVKSIFFFVPVQGISWKFLCSKVLPIITGQAHDKATYENLERKWMIHLTAHQNGTNYIASLIRGGP